MIEALRALEKKWRHILERGYSGSCAQELERCADELAAILATASEQAPVAWVIRDSATEKMVWDFEATVFDSEGDVHEFIGQLKDDDENVEGLEPAAVSFSSPAHTSEARDADFLAIERGCAALLGGATWAAMHPEGKRAYRDKLSAAMRQEGGSDE